MGFSGIDLGIAAGVAARETASNYQEIIDDRDVCIEKWICYSKRFELKFLAAHKSRMGWQRRALVLEAIALENGKTIKELRAECERYNAIHRDEINRKIDAKSEEIRLKVYKDFPVSKNRGY